MDLTTQPHELARFRQRRRVREHNQRLLRNLPLAHRLAAARACLEPDRGSAQLLEQAVVGLVEAADRFPDADRQCRFGIYAAPFIRAALERERDERAIDAAQAEIAAAMSSQERVRELAEFLDCPVEALVGSLMDVVAQPDGFGEHHRLRGAA